MSQNNYEYMARGTDRFVDLHLPSGSLDADKAQRAVVSASIRIDQQDNRKMSSNMTVTGLCWAYGEFSVYLKLSAT